MIKITKKLLRSWNACWTDEKLDIAFGKRRFVTPEQVANATEVSLQDQLWVLTHCIDHHDTNALVAFAVETALSVVHMAGELEDELRGILNNILAAEDLPESERGAAYTAAYTAAYAAYAAYAAARAANAANAARAARAAYAAARAANAARTAPVRDSYVRDSLLAAYAAVDAAVDAANAAARAADVSLQSSIDRALEWLGEKS